MDTKLKPRKPMTCSKIIFFYLFFNLALFTGRAQTNLLGTADKITTDIRSGRLPNGFTYFLKPVPSESRTLMRLMHRAGSNQDDPDQRNTAHVIEHLAYKSSKSFPEGIINSDQMAALDMTMYDYAATNGNRGTYYEFDVPPGDTTALDVGLLWFRDIISGLHLTNSDIDNARGEVLQEYLGKHANNLNETVTHTYLESLLFPCSQDYSNYMDYLQEFSPDVLRRFYKDWSRPDLYGISVVGNIDDLEEMEKRIRESFSNIPQPRDPRKPRICDTEYYNRPPQYYVVERLKDSTKFPQYNAVTVDLIFRDPITAMNLNTIKGLKRLMIMETLAAAIDLRLKEVTNHYKSFNLYSMYPYRIQGMPPQVKMVLELENVPVKSSIEKAFDKINQLREYGVTKQEWKKLKQIQIQNLRAKEEKNAHYWLKELKKYFINGEALSENKDVRLKNWFSDFTLAEFNEVMQKFLSKVPEDIGIIAPTGHIALSYKEKEVRSWINHTYNEEPEPYRPPEVQVALLSGEKLQGLQQKGIKDKRSGPSDFQEFVLKNGLKVVLNPYDPTQNGNGKIMLHGFSEHGAKSFEEKDYFSAINSPLIVKNAGVNGMNKFELERFLAKNNISDGIRLYVSDYEAGVKSETRVKDLEVILQLIYLYFKEPNKSRIAFEDWKIKARRAYVNPSYSLDINDFNVAWKEVLGESGQSTFFDSKYLSGTKRFEGIAKTNFQTAYRIFRRLYGNPEDFTFIISGDFEVGTVLPLIDKYLGNLPERSYSYPFSVNEDQKKIPSAPAFVNLPPPENYWLKNVMYGFTFIEEARDSKDWKEHIIVEALARVATQKAFSLRFEKGYSIYDVSVWGHYDHQMNRYEIGTVLPTVPEEYSEIRKELKRILFEIRAGNITKNEFQNGLRLLYIFHSATRPHLLMYPKIYEHYRYQVPWVDPIEEESFTRSITIEDIVEAANKYVKKENLYEFVMKEKDIEKEN